MPAGAEVSRQRLVDGRRTGSTAPRRAWACGRPAVRAPSGTTRRRRTPAPGRPPGPRRPPPGRRRGRPGSRSNRSSVSAPVPQTSRGLVGARPGSSSGASRSVVAADRGANGTPSRSATSAASTRSAPESCTVAMPPPRRRTRRPIAKHSRLSTSSPRSSTRCTPYAANSASQRGVGAGEGARVGVDERLPALGAADGQRDDRDVARRRPRPAPGAAGRVPQGLQHQAHDPGLGQVEGVGEIVGGRGDHLLARTRRPGSTPAGGGCAAWRRTPTPSGSPGRSGPPAAGPARGSRWRAPRATR